jgi:GNAT superfamily N-acetyltransferase
MMELTIVQPTDQPVLYDLFWRMFADAPEAYGKTSAEAESAAAEESAMWERYLARIPGAIGVIAWVEGQPCGFVMGCVGKLVNGNLDDNYTDVVTLGRMWVDPAQRRRGIATTLIETIENWTRQKGIQRLELWVMVSNHAAHTLYRNAGFVDTPSMVINTEVAHHRLGLMVKELR